jgi:hypothetical protein
LERFERLVQQLGHESELPKSPTGSHLRQLAHLRIPRLCALAAISGVTSATRTQYGNGPPGFVLLEA